MLNPLIDEIFELILTKQVWQVHTLAAQLSHQGAIATLDQSPERDLFKRNFLIMNALYQLQAQLKPQNLIISTLHIELLEKEIKHLLVTSNNLRDYYLDWNNYDTSEQQVEELLNSFWRRFKATPKQHALTNQKYNELILKWDLPEDFTLKALQKRWRQLALQNHPDKLNGCAEKFKKIKLQYEQLKTAAR
ncbi:DNA-J related domain-containing protein [Pseudoalteromonas carrageenovora]|uniref:DNA-J related domain-containing protein n=1 Tax=Pseudoalteromonas carrageenovora TaxID=227 RepID=UPI0021198036|nr:DNA-J related domain-containing protein [Pseudoalteromonas carrageenovora]MCQ8891313.1 DnaJ domain-containing protein [Pseudoalteromonas carrageenovora]MDO6464877.1 DNA-J related domain-containing protein [Pseudoalteromonas carrageenovora]MDO6836648.1 DNA-J related domain-containing protein [Pseudoalteromonas carrageenovora]